MEMQEMSIDVRREERGEESRGFTGERLAAQTH